MAKNKVRKKNKKPRVNSHLRKEEAFLLKAKFIRTLDATWEDINTACLEEFFRNHELLVGLMDTHYSEVTKSLLKDLESVCWKLDESSDTFEEDLSVLGQKVIDSIKAIGSGEEYENIRNFTAETITKSTLNVMEEHMRELVKSIEGLPVKTEFLNFYTKKKYAVVNICEDFMQYISCEVGDLYLAYAHKLINALNVRLDGRAVFVYEAKQEDFGAVSEIIYYKYNKESVVLVNDIKETGDTEELKYISDYKELNRLAEVNGYNFVRCSGDHGIFKNDTGKIVIIPQGRSVGKGLSIKIQKDLIYPGGIYEGYTC